MGALIRVVCFLALALTAHGADVIPADRKVTWEGYVGTEGGIPYREVDSVLTGIDNTKRPVKVDGTGRPYIFAN